MFTKSHRPTIDRSTIYQNAGYREAAILLGIWLLCAILDGIWLWIDRSEPAWDQGAHLVAAMQHWRHLQVPQPFSSDWWTQLWSLSPNYRGPLVYLLTVPFLQILGPSADSAIAVNQLFSAFLIPTVYGLGRCLFNRSTGLWSAGLCALAPTLTFVRLDYLLDYGITTVMVIAFTLLTLWWRETHHSRTWFWSLGFGGALGCAILAKPTSLLFFLLPIAGLIRRWIRQRDWRSSLQFGLAMVLAGFIPAGWMGQNWLTIITSMLNANAVGRSEGDPSFTTLAGWLYYLQRLPSLVSWPFLVSAIAGGIFVLRRPSAWKLNPEWTWLGSYALGFYGLCTLATNKDLRFILPITPILVVMGVQGLLAFPNKLNSWLRWGMVALAMLLLVYALFPLPGSERISDRRLASPTPVWPVQEVVNTIYQANPYQISTLGMLVDTPQIQAFNVDFYGTLANFQVLGRQLGFDKNFIEQDARALTWYLTKTGDQGSWKEHPVITPLRERVEADPALAIARRWPLPDQSELRLYCRQTPAIRVTPYHPPSQALLETIQPIQVTRVQIPAQATPGSPIAVTYELQGRWDALRNGILILTWQLVNGKAYWVHDHAIALNELATSFKSDPQEPGATIQETLATLPSNSLPLGIYQLKAWYLDRQTQTATALKTPTAQVELVRSPIPPATIARDRNSQLRQIAQSLRQGQLDDVFKQVGPMNQYGSVQSYLQTAASAARYRLSQNPQDVESAYTLVLSQVLQRNVPGAIAALQQVTQIDAQNPYAWAYLAFVYLFNRQPQASDVALAQVTRLNPQLPELKVLQIATAMMQGKLIQVVQLYRTLSSPTTSSQS